ncbi:TonB-dependent receptor [Candidatus Haliotispira prima]|uniref:TonB-dependent receptor n=1 Tax=Candidatus Haliotispira prima TaxID=3034016 RepID=A0ABY8MF25_9SPIO|nr:TonB-dependent receptor [Candidatus Haliotispira prima]
MSVKDTNGTEKKQSDVEVDRIVVTGSKTEQSEQEVVANVEIIDSEQIEQMGVQNLRQVIENIPGANIVKHGASAASLQGLGGEYVKILVDGVEVVGDSGNAVDLDTIPIGNAERIEIVRGPSSILYGSEAIGGVINIITKKEQKKPIYLEAAQEATSATAFNGRLFTGINLGLFYFSVAGSYDYDDGHRKTVYDSENFSESYQKYDPATRTYVPATKKIKLPIVHYLVPVNFLGSINPKIGLRGDMGFLELSGLYSKFSNSYTSDTEKHTGSNTEARRLEAGVSGKLKIQENINLGGFARWKYFDSGVTTGPYTDKNSETMEDNTFEDFEAEIYYNMTLFSHRLLFGLNGKLETLTGDSLGGGNEKAGVFALYAQDTWNLGSIDKFYLAFGGRLDVNPPSRTEDTVLVHATPKFSLRWNPAKEFSIRASYGMGYKTPTLKEKYYTLDHSTRGYKVFGNPDLKPEISHGINLSVNWQLQKWLELGMGGYFNYLLDMIATRQESQVGRTTNYKYQNVDEALTAGADIGLKISPDFGLGFDLAYSWLIVAQEKTDGKTEFVDMLNKIKHQVKGSLSYRIQELQTLFRLGFRWQATQEYQSGSTYAKNLQDETSPDLLLLDFRIEQPLPGGFKVYGGIENLLHNLHFAKGTEDGRSSQKDYYNLHDEITFFAGVSYSN